MKQHRVQFGALLVWVVLAGQIYTVGVKADVNDDLRRSMSAVNQDLIDKTAEIASEIQENARIKNDLRDMMRALDEHASNLRDLLKGGNEDLKEKIGAINEQVKKLKEQVKKLEALQEKIATLMPKFEDALAQDQSADESRRILAAISQDDAKVTRLLQAIADNKPAEIASLLGQGARGPKLEVREVKNAGSATVVFRVGNLVQCLSTKSQCGGKSSSVTKAAAGAVPSAVEALKPLKDALAASSKRATADDGAIDSLLSDLKAALGATSISQEQAMQLQGAAAQIAEATERRSKMFQKLATAIDAMLSSFS